ncbi:sugar phosphate isomerase/epimerase [Phototrophicus methaneseepsis]|uniref:Sugar phosphate isomerase/epimerase n=1 Tax=Phototrophicus methaneseepsis TaxID=2710758 RepID=A0A7S8E6L3_9CHLR|nr:sugar phosphate isomerase/epimerase family protein [Phototrophicus methaneseepsis]QPC81326.1 sugar phosphate isomerase/epimerase [Phototrophicus methaneseepsis]
MQLGISSWAFQWLAGRPGHPPPSPLTPLGLLDKATSLGVKVVQIADNLPIHAYPEDVIAEFGAVAHDRRMTIEVGTSGLDPENLCRYLELAKQFGSKLVRTNSARPDGDAGFAKAVEQLQSVMPLYEKAGILLALENYDHFPVGELAHLIRAVDSPNIGSCVDPGNSLSCNEDTAHVLDALAPLAFNLHVKDIAIFREPYNMGFLVEGRACGQGQLDFSWLIGRIQEEGLEDVNAILECWTPWQGSIEASLQLEDVWIKESIRYLRALIPN